MDYISKTKSARIAATLEEMILDNQLKSGSFLPSHQILAEQFNTSSRPIREALKLHEARGLIVVSQGRKAQVRSNSLDQYVESISTTIVNSKISQAKLMRNLMQVRITVATSAAREFSRLENRKEYLSQLWTSSNKMEAAVPLIFQKDAKGLMDFNLAESDFHRTLVVANGNQILSCIYDNLSPMLDSAMRSIKFTAHQLEKRSKDYLYLCEALQNGQTDLAVALVLVTLNTLESKVMDHYPDENALISYA
ncbi:MAG: FadR family transcriptional regulator [Spirochaetia bacterium]|nr:FadR family transcriptional regulator [Spirochaetia bacterium]